MLRCSSDSPAPPVPMNHNSLNMGMDPKLSITPTWTIHVSDARTVKVSNLSLAASERDVREFFSFSGDVRYVEMRSESERSQKAYVTFKDSQGADAAILLSGATIVDLSVTITPAEDYQLPQEAYDPFSERMLPPNGSAVRKAEDMASTMLAKGYVLGKDAIKRARSFDERTNLISNASAAVVSLDRKIGLSEKISTGSELVSGKVREVDECFQVSERTKSALAAAEQKASSMGSAIMGNSYVSTGASWVSNAIHRVANLAGDVSQMTKEKVERAEEDRKEAICIQRKGMVNEFAQIHLDEGETPVVPVDSVAEHKLEMI